MTYPQIVVSVDNRMYNVFKETIDAFMLVNPTVKWVVTGGVGEDGNLVTLYTSSGGTPADFFTLGSLLFELHGTIFLDVYNAKQ